MKKGGGGRNKDLRFKGGSRSGRISGERGSGERKREKGRKK